VINKHLSYSDALPPELTLYSSTRSDYHSTDWISNWEKWSAGCSKNQKSCWQGFHFTSISLHSET